MVVLTNNYIKTIFINFRHYSALCKSFNPYNHRNKHHSPVIINTQRWLFWEKDRKGGYDTTIKQSNWEHIKNGFRELKTEFKLFGEEIKELIITDPVLVARPGKCIVRVDEACTRIILLIIIYYLFTILKPAHCSSLSRLFGTCVQKHKPEKRNAC